MMQRILVVDDSATVRRVVGRTLSQAGYDVSLATDGREALEVAQREVPNLVLVDFVMPHMNGFQLVQALRQVANLTTVPVVLMSAKADKIGDGFLAQTGALDAITKPFSPEALLAVTGHALSRWASEEARDTEPPPPPMDGERHSVPPMMGEPPSETSPLKLAEAADQIAERLAGAFAETLDARPEDITEALIRRFEPAALFTLIDELAQKVPGREGEVALRGRLEHVPMGDVLQLLTHQRQSGVLEVEKRPSRSGRSIAVCLEDGAVQLALGRVEEQEFRLGRYLLREQLIEREDLERILQSRGASRGLLGAQLVKLGYISGQELNKVLVRQTSELIYEALRWHRGEFRFVRFASLPQAEDARLGLSLSAILMEGLRRVDEWRLIEEQVRSLDDVPRRDEEALRTVDPSRWSADERAVLEAVDSERTVREIIERSKLGSFDACKILFQLLTSRLLRI